MDARATGWRAALRPVDGLRWELPVTYRPGMRVPGLIFADEELLALAEGDQSGEQVANVAFLPGIVGHSIAMPDMHWGYGFPIGGVAATRVEDGVVSPGGVGFDINCGTRVILTELDASEVQPILEPLVNQLFRDVPSGLGRESGLSLTAAELDDILRRGAAWAVEHGHGRAEDLERIESGGTIPGADQQAVGERPRKRGQVQLGTLGSGNHFLEVQTVEEILDPAVATAFGLRHGQVIVFLHTGSRGFGHQVCEDYLKEMEAETRRQGYSLPDRQLACAPVRSSVGRRYLAAMAAAANYAFANRQVITQRVRQAFARVTRRREAELGLRVLYDVAHNIAKIERHTVDGAERELCVHRKGATRAFPAGHPEVPACYREVGQPVLVPGDMGRYSYILVGEPRAMQESWGSVCHGAGRLRSRHGAKALLRGVDVAQQLARKGIVVRSQSKSNLAEEASEAYKDVKSVVEVVARAGLSRPVARMRPLGVVKG
ncbi:MAG TPA: RtcB family protein [Chloroflexota bacterium]|nr:RtcB family protein [Chloroflexota bacterium]